MFLLRKYRWLAPSLLFTIALLALRIGATGKLMFCFLPWNLFLAALPVAFAEGVIKHRGTNPRLAWLFAILWLLFFPNALYITTDLFHLHHRPPVPLWYDLLLLLSAAFNGALYGFISLRRMEGPLRRLLGKRGVGPAIFGLLVLCGFGIYLGRYLRYNSWDVAANPFGLMEDVLEMVLHPRRYIEVWGMSGVFGIWGWVTWRLCRRMQRMV